MVVRLLSQTKRIEMIYRSALSDPYLLCMACWLGRPVILGRRFWHIAQHKYFYTYIYIYIYIYMQLDSLLQLQRKVGFVESSSISMLFSSFTKMLHTKIDRSYNLTYGGQNKMAAISKTTFWNGFSLMTMFEFRLKFHWILSPGVQLTIFHH